MAGRHKGQQRRRTSPPESTGTCCRTIPVVRPISNHFSRLTTPHCLQPLLKTASLFAHDMGCSQQLSPGSMNSLSKRGAMGGFLCVCLSSTATTKVSVWPYPLVVLFSSTIGLKIRYSYPPCRGRYRTGESLFFGKVQTQGDQIAPQAHFRPPFAQLHLCGAHLGRIQPGPSR